MSEDEITLLRNVEDEELSSSVPTTINMNGFSITGSIEASDSLTLTNGTVVGSVKVDDATFTMTAPADADAAIDGGLTVNSGSCSVTGAKIGVKGTLYFDGTDMTITGTDKAVALDKAAEPASKTFYGSTDVDGDTTEEAKFEDGTYKVSGGIAKKLSNQPVGGSTEPADPTLTITPASLDIAAGETATFTVTHANGTDTLNAYVQEGTRGETFTVTLTKAEDGTYTLSVTVDEKTPSGNYTLFVHETNNTFVQATATINVTAKCFHGGAGGFDNNADACPYCDAPAVAQTALKNVTGFPWRNFANLQDALDADRSKSDVVRLLTNVSGEYTIDGSVYTGLDLNRHSLNGTVTLTGEKGSEVSFSTLDDEGTVQEVIAHANAKLAVSGAAAVIKKLTLADGATWENIVSSPRDPGYKVYTDYPDLTKYTWYAPEEVSDTLTELTNVTIERLPITSKNLSITANGSTVYSTVERDTTALLRAYCNTSGANVTFSIINSETAQSVATLTGTYNASTQYYVAEYSFNTIGDYEVYFVATMDSYSITPKGLTSNNYAITFESGTLTVTTATATVTAPTAKTLTYTGDEQALVDKGSTTGGTMLYSLDGTNYSDAIPTGTDAGSYTVWYKVDGGGNYENVASKSVSVIIEKADLTNVSVAQSGTLTYNGHEQTATVTAQATVAGSQAVTFTYCAEENGTYTPAVPAFTGQGTYTVYYKASAANHNDVFGQFTVKIDPLNISGAAIALAAAELTYNGQAQSPTITSVTVNGLTLTAGRDYTVTGNTGKDAKGYTLTITGTGNFTGTATANWAITPKDITGATVTLGAGLTYNGQEQTQKGASVITPDGLHVTYDVSNDTGTDAKDYTLTVTGKGNFQGKVTQAFTIAQLDIASATVTLGDALVYNGQEQTQTVASVKVGELTVPADTYTVTHNTGKKAGKYTLTVTVNSGNFTGKTTWEFPVNKAVAADQSTDLTVVNNAVKDYTVDLSALLPALKVLERYGNISYGRPEFTTSGLAEGESYTVQTSVDDRGLLTVKVLSTSGGHEGPIGTVSVVVTTDNFADFTLTVNVSAANKIIPTGGPTLSRDWLRYGETIGAIRLSGSVTLTVKDIPEDIHVVTGQVIYVQGDGSTVGPVSGADVTIVRGTKTLSRTTTDADGNFSLAGVPSGEYNIVVKVNTNPAKTVTAKLVLTTEDKDVQMSAIKVRTEDINSKLDVSKSPFDIVVGGLDRLAESVFDNDNTATSVTARMTIDQPATDGNDPHQKAPSGKRQAARRWTC